MSTESVDDAVSLLRGWDILDGCDDALLSTVKYIHAFSDMGALFVTEDDSVYGVGQNGEHNLLGVESVDWLREVLEEPVKVPALCGKGVSGISVGMWLGAAVTREGELYRWGFESEDTPILLPTQVTLYSSTKFTQVACGASFFAALTDKHQVYMWGSMNMCTEPTDARLLSLNHSITSFSCGWWHVALLTEKGQVFTCGYGEDGQLGDSWSEYDDIYAAKKMDIRPVVKQVVCGSISTLCLSTYGEIWACGENDIWQGSLGVDSEEYCIVQPKKVRIDAIIKEITATWGSPNIYAALSAEGRVYCWGESRYPALLKNISSLIEACRNERTSFEVDQISFLLEPKTSVRPLVYQTDPINLEKGELDDDSTLIGIDPECANEENPEPGHDGSPPSEELTAVENDNIPTDSSDSQGSRNEHKPDESEELEEPPPAPDAEESPVADETLVADETPADEGTPVRDGTPVDEAAAVDSCE